MLRNIKVLMRKKTYILIILAVLGLSFISYKTMIEVNEHAFNLADEYNQLCSEKDFSDESLSKVIERIHDMNWSDYYNYSIENENFESLFWILRDYKFDKESLTHILNIQGTDGAVDEDFMSLIEYVYNNEEYKVLIDEMIKSEPIANTNVERFRNAFD